MIGRALDPITNDLFLQNNSIATVSDDDQTVQSTKTRLLFFLEEWFLDTIAGTAYTQQIFNKPVNLNNTETIIKTRILQTPGISALNTFDLQFNSETRGIIISFEATTDNGSTIQNEVNINV